MKLRRTVFAMGLLGLIVVSMWIAFAQEREEEEKAAVVGVITELVKAALARDVEAVKAKTDLPLLVVEGIGGRAVTVKEEELEGLLQMVYAPPGIVLEVGRAEVLLMGSTASAQVELVSPGGPDLGLSGRCACILVKKDGEWKVRATAYYGY